MITYVTDVEGRWDKLAEFAAGNPLVTLDDGLKRTIEYTMSHKSLLSFRKK